MSTPYPLVLIHRWARARCLSFWLLLGIIFLQPIEYWVVLHSVPSTLFFDPEIVGDGVTEDDAGVFHAALGDRIYVTYHVIRFAVNGSLSGSCFMKVWRYGRDVGGPTPGRRHLLSYAELQFVGDGIVRQPRWPLEGLVLGYDVTMDNKPDLSRPILKPGVDAQEFELFVEARYFCNPIDYVIPRWLQGGVTPDESESVRLVVRRRK